MYRNTLLFLLGGIVVLLSVTLTSAESFNGPPETDPLVPPGGWETTFPYPRNVLIDFDTDPATWPADPNGPAGSLDLVPDLNYHIEGTDDQRLYPSDWGEGFGGFTWIDTDPRFLGRQGLAGIDNQQNQQVVARLHLDNEPITRPLKHLWIEMEYYLENGSWQTSMVPNFTDMRFRHSALSDGWSRRTWWFLIEPGPPWEDLTIELQTDVAQPGTVLFDYLHVATEAVPEPGTCTLLGTGSLALIIWFWRRKRAK